MLARAVCSVLCYFFTLCFSLGFLTEYDIGLPDYTTMDDADKYLQVYNNTHTIILCCVHHHSNYSPG